MMKKRILSLCLVLCLTLALLPVLPVGAARSDAPYAAEGGSAPPSPPLEEGEDKLSGSCGTQGDNILWELDLSTGELTITGTGKMRNFNELPDWYAMREQIVSVRVGEGVRNIGDYAFLECSSLTDVTLPDSLEEIGDHAFAGCTALAKIFIPENVSCLGTHAFFEDNHLEYVLFYGDAPELEGHVFDYLGLGGYFTLPLVTLYYIPEKADWTTPTWGGYPTAKWDGTGLYFSGDCGIDGDNVRWTLELNSGVVRVTGSGAMDQFGFLPSGEHKPFSPLGAYTDYIKTAEIADGVTTIGAQFFAECDHLTDVTIPNSITVIEAGAFAGCDALREMPFSDSLQCIEEEAFLSCDALQEAHLPATLRELGRDAFTECASLERFTVDEGNECFSADDRGVLFDRQKTTLLRVPQALSGAYTVPGTVTKVADFAGSSCSRLTELTLANCELGIGTFQDCAALWRVTVDGVKTISSYTFQSCPSLKEVSLSGAEQIGDFAFAHCDALQEIRLPDTLTAIGHYAFYGTALKEVEVPGGVTELGSSAFEDCKDLTRAVIRGELSSVKDNTFAGCSALQEVALPDSITEIGSNVFSFCTSLKSIDLPDNLTAIYFCTFLNCSALTSVTIPEGVTLLDTEAFAECTGLRTVLLPASLKTINGEAFFQCSALQSVYFAGDAPEIGSEAFYETIPDTEDLWDTQPISGLTLYYIEGKAGWTSPTWNDYPTATWDGATVPDPCASGHTWGDWTVSKAATCTAPGEETRTCAVCGEAETREIKALGHDYQDGACTRCGEKDPNASSKPSTPTFTDVPANAWFVGAVDYAVENELMNGMGNDEFQPNTSMTRGMLVTVLWRYADSPKQGENTFTDVPAGKYYTDAVAWAAANGIVNGVGDGKFNPDGNITREQLVTILYRYCKQLNIDTSKADDLTGFPDAGNVGNSAKDAMRWAVAEKLIGGKTLDASGTVYLQPKGSATRAEVATILMRFIENILK